MASERFVAIQEAVQASPETPTWERWTIDEVDEGVVRVLVSEALDPEELRTISEAILAPEARGPRDHATRNALHRQAMRVELARSEQRWSSERAIFMAQSVLEPLLRERTGKPGLPTNRPLREGDVFWVILPAGSGLALPPDRGATLDIGAARVAQYLRLGADVWDVTAAARQVAKQDYHHSVRIAADAAVADAASGAGNPYSNVAGTETVAGDDSPGDSGDG
jgi:hypothetical protein